MKKYIIGILSSVFVVASLVAFRDHAVAMWAAPNELNELSQEYQEAYEQTNQYIEHQKEFNNQQRTQNVLAQERWESYKETQAVQRQVLLELLKK